MFIGAQFWLWFCLACGLAPSAKAVWGWDQPCIAIGRQSMERRIFRLRNALTNAEGTGTECPDALKEKKSPIILDSAKPSQSDTRNEKLLKGFLRANNIQNH